MRLIRDPRPEAVYSRSMGLCPWKTDGVPCNMPHLLRDCKKRGLTKALPRPAMERQRDHNMGIKTVQYKVHDKIFRDNAHKFENKQHLPAGYVVHFTMCRTKF